MDLSEQMYGDQDSGFFPRMVGPPKDFLRGSANNRPFRPGGLEDSQSSSERILPHGVCDGQWVQELLNGGPPQNVPPSFKQSLDLGGHLMVSYIVTILCYYLIHSRMI